MVILFLIFLRNLLNFFKDPFPIGCTNTFPPTVFGGFLFSTSLPILVISCLFDNCLSDRYEMISPCGFNLHYHSLLKDNFAGYRILLWQVFFFQCFISFYSFPACMVSEKPDVSPILAPPERRCFLSLAPLKIFSMILVFCNLNIICLCVEFLVFILLPLL